MFGFIKKRFVVAISFYMELHWVFVQCSSAKHFVAFTIYARIGAYFVYYKYMSRNKESVSKCNYIYPATKY